MKWEKLCLHDIIKKSIKYISVSTFKSLSGDIFEGTTGKMEGTQKRSEEWGNNKGIQSQRKWKEYKKHEGRKCLYCSSPVVGDPVGFTCEKEEKKPGRQKKKVDGDEKDSFFYLSSGAPADPHPLQLKFGQGITKQHKKGNDGMFKRD